MNTISVKKSTSLRIDRDLYDYIERQARKENRSVNNYIETILSKATDFKLPNRETREAIAELERDKATLKRYSGAKNLFEDLEG
ncbi:hypothetical protein [Parapedobacter tibetensis]|uniref:hypothetical protein n=1 Tax=Parapedobacter tibetensis TaxID=2972951 RepID=UPI00214DCCD3|nr:hypothetical protein [Parapedobacter tibetensis]